MSKVNEDEWTVLSGAFCAAQGAASDAFAALAEFDSKAPSGQAAYNAWRDANDDERDVLEHATIVAALNYFTAHAAEREYFERLDDMDARAARYETSVTRPRVSKKDVLKGPAAKPAAKISMLEQPPREDMH